MVRSVAYVFLGALFASLLISTIAANGDHEKNAVEANQATGDKQVNDYGGGGGGGYVGGGGGGGWGGSGGGGWPGNGGGWPGNGGGWPGNGGGWPGHGGGWPGGCRWGRCCGRGGYYGGGGYCRCCYTAQEALAYMQNGLLD